MCTFLLANLLGGLGHWLARVFGRIGDMSPYWLVFALGLKTVESALIGLVWRNILRAAYPKSGLSFKVAWGASQGERRSTRSCRLRGGTAAMIGIFRASVPGASVSGLAAATVVESLFFGVVSVLMVIAVSVLSPHMVSRGSPSNESSDFLASHPYAVPLAIVAVVVVAALLWPRLKPRVLQEWSKARKGAAIFSDWHRYATEVALPSTASYCCRTGVNVVFMAAFGIPITVFTVLLVASSHTLSQIFAITPGGVGQTQALDVAMLSRYGSSAAAAAFSIAQDSVMTIWNVVLGLVVMLWAFGWGLTKDLVFRRDRGEEATEPAVLPPPRS